MLIVSDKGNFVFTTGAIEIFADKPRSGVYGLKISIIGGGDRLILSADSPDKVREAQKKIIKAMKNNESVVSFWDEMIV